MANGNQQQPSQPPNPNQPPNQGGGQQESSSSGGWLKWVLGCGCLAVFLAMCGAGSAIAFSGYFIQSMVKTATEGVEVRQEVREKRRELVERKDIKVRMEEPLSQSDYDDYEATMDEWMDTEPFREIKSLKDYGDKNKGEQGPLETLGAMYKLWKSAAAIQKLGALYVEAIENHGGVAEHYRRFTRIGAVIAAAHEVSTDHRFDNPGSITSDAVAKLLYKEHGKVQEAYGDKLEKLRSGDDSFQELAQKAELGTYAIATLPRESYKPWFDYTKEEREEFFGKFVWSIAAETVTFGDFAFPVSVKTPFGK